MSTIDMSTYTLYIFIDHNQIFDSTNFLNTKKFIISEFVHHFLITTNFYLIRFSHIEIFDHILFSPPGWSVITFPPLSTSDISAISIYISTIDTYIYISTIDIHSITSCSRHQAGA